MPWLGTLCSHGLEWKYHFQGTVNIVQDDLGSWMTLWDTEELTRVGIINWRVNVVGLRFD